MKESKSRARFEEISKTLREEESFKTVLDQMGRIRDAIRAMRDDGFDVELEVRPSDDGCRIETVEKGATTLLNGTIRAEGIAIEFKAVKNAYGSLLFDAYLGRDVIMHEYLYITSDIGSKITDATLRVCAQAKMAEEFNVNSSGPLAASLDKTIAVPARLKVRKNPNP